MALPLLLLLLLQAVVQVLSLLGPLGMTYRA
jgi:hypothetical protein